MLRKVGVTWKVERGKQGVAMATTKRAKVNLEFLLVKANVKGVPEKQIEGAPMFAQWHENLFRTEFSRNSIDLMEIKNTTEHDFKI